MTENVSEYSTLTYERMLPLSLEELQAEQHELGNGCTEPQQLLMSCPESSPTSITFMENLMYVKPWVEAPSCLSVLGSRLMKSRQGGRKVK